MNLGNFWISLRKKLTYSDKNTISQKRKRPRIIENLSVARKKFKRLVETSKQISISLTDPSTVITDLKNGSLESLGRYIEKHGSIPNEEIASELGNLLRGQSQDTRYRLAIIDHPDLPPNPGGAPKSMQTRASASDVVIWQEVDYLRVQRKLDGGAWKVEAVVEDVAEKLGITQNEVHNARRRVKKSMTADLRHRRIEMRRNEALENLRKKTSDKG